MARKSSGLSGVAIGLLLIVALLIEAIKNYWPILLILGVVGLVFWLISKQTPKDSSPQRQIPTPAKPTYSPPPRTTNYERATSAPRQPAGGNIEVTWLPDSKSISISGYQISGGLIFVGNKSSGDNGWRHEASLINPSLPVNTHDDDYAIRKLNYWPSYSEASAGARASYLRWLANGRSDPRADIGYVFLYFYGLERRSIVDASQDEKAKADIPTIIRELERLLGIYSENNSFRQYCGSLLNLLQGWETNRECPDIPPALSPYGELTFFHKICLGNMAVMRRPLPAEWALCWMMGDPTTRLRTAAQRCPEEFKRAFIAMYTEKYGEGIIFPQNKTKLKISHYPASPSINRNGAITRVFDLPDVTVLSSPVKKLQEIAEICLESLDSYSRYIGRNPEKADSADAMLELPFSLWTDQYRKPFEDIKATILTTGKPIATKFKKVQTFFPAWHDSNRQRYQSFSRALSEAGLGIEPDIKFGGKVPEPDSTIVLFPDDEIQAYQAPTPEYSTAALTLHLAVAVSTADGNIGEEEKQLLLRQMEDWLHLKDPERRRLQAHLRLLLSEPPNLNNLKKRIEALNLDSRQAIGAFLAEVAKADNEVTPAEVKLLEKIFKLLEIDTQSLYSMLHGGVQAPVTVKTAGKPASGFAIPGPPKPKESGFELDMGRIAGLHAESEKITAILGSIFVEDVTPVEVEPEVKEEASPILDSLLGLNEEHTAFLRMLMTRPSWDRDELEELAKDRGLLLDGALENINEAAYEYHDMPFFEGDDPVEINQEIVKEVLQ